MDKNIIDKWMYNLNGGELWMGDEFNTKEEAIKMAKEEINKEGLEIDSFEIGQIVEVQVCGLDVDFILENVAENTTSECGEVGDDYLYEVTKEDKSELEDKLNEVFFKWIKDKGYEPDFFKIDNTEKIELDHV